MKQYIMDERTGLKYELIGDYYLIAGDDEPKQKSIGIWGQRQAKYLRKHKHAVYSGLLISGKLDSYLRDIDRQGEAMFDRLMKELADSEGINEELKADDPLLWARRINVVGRRRQRSLTVT